MIGYLQEIYRWTIFTFLKNYITAKYNPKSQAKIYKKYTEKLSVAIFNNSVIKEALLPVKNIKLLKL